MQAIPLFSWHHLAQLLLSGFRRKVLYSHRNRNSSETFPVTGIADRNVSLAACIFYHVLSSILMQVTGFVNIRSIVLPISHSCFPCIIGTGQPESILHSFPPAKRSCLGIPELLHTCQSGILYQFCRQPVPGTCSGNKALNCGPPFAPQAIIHPA